MIIQQELCIYMLQLLESDMFDRFQKNIETCFLLLFFITPLLMFHKTSELFEFNKILFVYLVASCILAFWAGKMILAKKLLISKTPLNIPIFIFFVSQCISTVLSIDRHTSFFGYYSRFNGGLLSTSVYIFLYYALVSNCLFDKKEQIYDFVVRLLKAILTSSVIVMLWGLPGKLGHDLTCFVFTNAFNNTCWTDQFHPDERMFSTLGQPNWLGSFLIVGLCMGFYFLYKRLMNKRGSLMLSVYLFLTFSCILFTRSRSALFATAASLFIIGWYFIKNLTLKKKSIALFIACVLIVPLLLFKTGIVKIDSLLPGAQLLSSKKMLLIPPNKPKVAVVPSANVTDSFDIRKIVWRGAWNLGLKYPLFGTGVETFAYSYNFVKPVEHNLTSEWDFIYNKAHNEYLNYLATSGFVGLISYLFFIGSILYISVRDLQSKDSYSLIPFFAAAYISILITNFFGFSTVTINLFFYLLPGLIILLYHTPTHTSVSVDLAKNKKAIIISSLIVMFGVIFVVRYFVADVTYALGDGYLKEQNYDKAIQYLSRALVLKHEHVYQDKLSTALANKVFFDVYENTMTNDTNDKAKNEKLQTEINNLFVTADTYNVASITESPKNILYWKTRAKNYYILYQLTNRTEDFDKSINALDTAQKLAPTDPKIPYSKVLFYLSKFEDPKNKKNNPLLSDGAMLIKTIDHAIELKPNYRDAYFTKGLLLNRLGKSDEAHAVFQHMLSRFDPNDEEVKKELAK